MLILAIDPGTEKSAWVLYDSECHTVDAFGFEDNSTVLEKIPAWVGMVEPTQVVIEMVASYGMPVGREVFETVFWIGRFYEMACISETYSVPQRVYRKDVKLHLCGSSRAKDGNVRQAIIDRFPPSGVGRVAQIGTKAKPGPLYGIAGDVWQALGVALTWADEKAALDRALGQGA